LWHKRSSIRLSLSTSPSPRSSVLTFPGIQLVASSVKSVDLSNSTSVLSFPSSPSSSSSRRYLAMSSFSSSISSSLPSSPSRRPTLSISPSLTPPSSSSDSFGFCDERSEFAKRVVMKGEDYCGGWGGVRFVRRYECVRFSSLAIALSVSRFAGSAGPHLALELLHHFAPHKSCLHLQSVYLLVPLPPPLRIRVLNDKLLVNAL